MCRKIDLFLVLFISQFIFSQDCDDNMIFYDCNGVEFCNNDPDLDNWGYDCYVNNITCEDNNGNGIITAWVGDGMCDDGEWGLDFQCEEYSYDCGDCGDEFIDFFGYCEDMGSDDCSNNEVEDCSGDGDCCPSSWIADGYPDCEDQQWGCDLTCYNNDGGDCEGIPDSFYFEHNGETRQYYLYEPELLENNAPLVIVMHGYCGSATSIYSYSDMNSVADENGFAVCYPQGSTDLDGCPFWNVGYEFHPNEDVDDVDFISSLAQYLQLEYGYSSENTFASGMSNGAEMAYMLACQANDVFKAVAPVAGLMFESFYSTCDSSPISVFEIHGTNDNISWWEGDYDNEDGWGTYISVEEGIDFWIEANNCTESLTEFLPNTNMGDGSFIISHKNFGCIDNNEVWLYEVVNGGHDWPGSSGNMDINSSEEIWKFFSIHLLLGDLNQDGMINILDIIVLVNIVLENGSDINADLNNDGLINILDIVTIVNMILD